MLNLFDYSRHGANSGLLHSKFYHHLLHLFNACGAGLRSGPPIYIPKIQLPALDMVCDGFVYVKSNHDHSGQKKSWKGLALKRQIAKFLLAAELFHIFTQGDGLRSEDIRNVLLIQHEQWNLIDFGL